MPAGPATPPGPPPETPIPEMTVADATGLPDIPAPSQAGSDSAVTLRLSARLVDVPLVALDKKGRPIANLKPEELEIFDNGAKVNLRSFGQVESSAGDSAAKSKGAGETSVAGPEHAFSNRAAAAVQPAIRESEASSVILLIDSTLSFDDLSNTREQLSTFLKTLDGTQHVALYVMRVGGFQVLQEGTADHALVASTLAKWTPSAQNISLGQEQEARNRQTMDYVHNTEDLLSVNGNAQTDDLANQQAPDPKLRTLGDNPGRDALSSLVNVARHVGAIPGHKNLVWIASDNTLADWTNGSINVDKGSRVIESSVLRAQEAMNDAHVSVYPLDASRLEAGGVDAGIGNRYVVLNPTATVNQLPFGCGGIKSVDNTGPEASAGADIDTCGNDLRPGRATAQMRQDLRSIQGAYRELADATGGRAFRRASDMVSEFKSVVADGRATYLLSFSPATASDGKYHVITVKIPGRKDVELRYRTGFFYRQEPTTMKDRFREAILEPRDASEISLTADLLPGTNGRTVKLGIGAADLAIAQKDAFWTDRLDVFLAQREVSGEKARITGQTIGLRLKPATYQQYLREGIPFNQAVEPGAHMGSVRIVVVDENSGRMGSVTIPAASFTVQPDSNQSTAPPASDTNR
jgi:VWFA-related protein